MMTFSFTSPADGLPDGAKVDGVSKGEPANDNNTLINNSADNYSLFRPVVFQCKQCRVIVADSSDLAATDPLHRQISFSRPARWLNLQIDPAWHMQQDSAAFDHGSVYQLVKCRQCGAWLGLKYNTTTPETDHLRGLVTLKTNNLLMYELEFDDERVRREMEDCFGSLAVGAQTLAKSQSSHSNSTQSDVEIVKLQKFCLVLYDRVVRLEEQVIALNAVRH